MKATGDPATLPPSAVPPGTATGHLPHLSSVLKVDDAKVAMDRVWTGLMCVLWRRQSFPSHPHFFSREVASRRGAPSTNTLHTAQHSLSLFPMGYHKVPSFTLADVVYKSEGCGYRGAHAGCVHVCALPVVRRRSQRLRSTLAQLAAHFLCLSLSLLSRRLPAGQVRLAGGKALCEFGRVGGRGKGAGPRGALEGPGADGVPALLWQNSFSPCLSVSRGERARPARPYPSFLATPPPCTPPNLNTWDARDTSSVPAWGGVSGRIGKEERHTLFPRDIARPQIVSLTPTSFSRFTHSSAS